MIYLTEDGKLAQPEYTEQGPVYPEGSVPVYLSFDRSSLWAMVRAPSREVFDDRAKTVGLLVPKEPGSPEQIDPDTGEVIKEEIPPSEELVPSPGVTITRIGSYTLVPGEYDSNGNELKAPQVDNRYHVNFWLHPTAIKLNRWQQWALAWTINGQEVPANNKEQAVQLNEIELIDPDTVNNPENRLL